MSKRFTLLAIVVLLIFSLSIHFFGRKAEKLLGRGIDETSENGSPFAIARQATSKSFDKEGRLSYTFTANKLEHFRPEIEQEESGTNNAYTLIEQPNIHMYREDAPWVIQAQKGKIVRSKDTITLEEDVNIQSKNPDKSTLTLKTDELTIYPQEKLAETASAVTIQSDSGIIRANGMKADLEKKKIRLISKVRGEHDPLELKHDTTNTP